MILYRITVRHIGPKDSHTSTQGYVIKESDEQVLDWLLAQELSYDDNFDEELEIYDEDYEIIGTETRREEWLRVGGQINSNHEDYSDTFYGITHYGWEEVGLITRVEIAVLQKFGALIEDENVETEPPVM